MTIPISDIPAFTSYLSCVRILSVLTPLTPIHRTPLVQAIVSLEDEVKRIRTSHQRLGTHYLYGLIASGAPGHKIALAELFSYRVKVCWKSVHYTTIYVSIVTEQPFFRQKNRFRAMCVAVQGNVEHPCTVFKDSPAVDRDACKRPSCNPRSWSLMYPRTSCR